MKKYLFGIMFVLSAASMLSACGLKDEVVEKAFNVDMKELNNIAEDNAAEKEEAEAAGQQKTLKLFNGKGEVDAQIKELAQKYKAETGVNVEVESAQSGVDVQATLKAYYLSDKMPDIFVCESSGFANWEGLLVDLSDQAWAKDTEAEYVDKNNGTIGFPYATEAIGLIYNADLLSKAGIDPETLTGPELMEKAFETLDSKKDQLGLTAVVGYCAEDENLSWSTGNHIFGNYIDAGLDRSDTTYIDKINNEHADAHRTDAAADPEQQVNVSVCTVPEHRGSRA